MKRLFLTLAVIALVLPVVPRAQAIEVSVDFFYNNLSGGSWIEVADYGYCWQPDVAVSSSSWRPYADGYWTYTDLGWTWVSYEDFGWATYHYGRWLRLADRGWLWVPGRDSDLEWGPAWVSWRTGGDYVGWAPLPPRRGYGRVAITGHVDIEFDIGPAYYNFVEVRYIGEPVLRERIVESSRNVTYISQTVNVTNITYQNNVAYNYGPDYSALSARSSRPIQRLKLERQENVDVAAAAKSGALTKVEGDKLVVAAPVTIKRSATPVAPPTVKEKVAEAKVDKGWSGVSDPKAQEELKKKMQTEDAKKIPPPGAGASPAAQTAGSASPAASVNAGASASPAISASPATAASPAGQGKRLTPGGQVQPTAPGTPGITPATAASPTRPGKRGGEWQKVTPSPAGAPTASPGLTPSSGKGKIDRENLGATATPRETSAESPKGKAKPQLERGNLASPPPQPGDTSAGVPQDKKAKQLQPTGAPSLGGNESAEGGAGGKQKGPGVKAESPTAPTGAGPEREKVKPPPEGEKVKAKKDEKEPPSPAPQ